MSLALKLLLPAGPRAGALLRRGASRRRGRWDLSVVSAMVALLKEDKSLFFHLSSRSKFNLNARLGSHSSPVPLLRRGRRRQTRQNRPRQAALSVSE